MRIVADILRGMAFWAALIIAMTSCAWVFLPRSTWDGRGDLLRLITCLWGGGAIYFIILIALLSVLSQRNGL